MKKDPYQILGLDTSATDDDVRSAYKKTVERIKSSGAIDENARNSLIFAEHARDTLLNPTKRAQIPRSTSAGGTNSGNTANNSTPPNFGKITTVSQLSFKPTRDSSPLAIRHRWVKDQGLLAVFDNHLVLVNKRRSGTLNIVSAMGAVGAVIGAARDKMGSITLEQQLSDSSVRRELFNNSELIWCEKDKAIGKKWLYKSMLLTFSHSRLYCPFESNAGVLITMSSVLNGTKNESPLSTFGCSVDIDSTIYSETEVQRQIDDASASIFI